jgi:dipeptidyl aminopeptidase/acylaminoacyl peptidase
VSPFDMNPSPDFDRRLTAWLDDQAPMREPDGLTYAVLARTRRTRRMPRWASPERWLSMAVITRPALAPPLRIAWLLLIALLALALAAGATIVGAGLISPARPDDRLSAAYPIPVGGAAVLAFDRFIVDSNGQTGRDIYTVRADGSDMRQLTNGPGVESNVAWSPDGTRLAYWDQMYGTIVVMDASSIIYSKIVSCGKRSDLWIVASDGASPPVKLIADVTSSAGAWSPDGRQVAFVGTDEAIDASPRDGSGLYVADVGSNALAGGLQSRRISATGPDAPAHWLQPQWSPDGAEVAAVAGAENTCATPNSGSMDIYAVRADGNGQRLLASEAVDEFSPTWSPDGKRIAFQRQVDESEWWNGRPCTYRTWIADAAGGNELRLEPLEGDVVPPLWSPDGTRLVSYLAGTGPDGQSHGAVVTIDDSSPLVDLPDFGAASWQPVAAPLPPAPSFPAGSAAP